MTDDKYKRYAEISKLMTFLEKEKKTLAKDILEDMSTLEKTDLPTEYGKFKVLSKPRWEYSDKVEEMIEKLNIQKHREEQKGIAKKIESPYIRIYPIKAKDNNPFPPVKSFGSNIPEGETGE